MKRHIAYALLLALSSLSVAAQSAAIDSLSSRYRRSSLYSILLNHSSAKFADDIKAQFLNIPIPEQYNDHNLSVRVVTTAQSSKFEGNYQINQFVATNDIASHMVGKWFNRNYLDGTCDLELVKSRGLYDASAMDVELASRSARGRAMLEDAGEDLIGRTYLMVNEITYVDKNEGAKNVGGFLAVLGAVASAYTGDDSYASLGQTANTIAASYKGFSVKVHTRLYQLVWDEATSMEFYTKYYTPAPDSLRVVDFNKNRSKFKLTYVGDVTSKGGTTSFLGINEDQPQVMVRKACQRALDENIADLQKAYEQFRVKCPIVSVDPEIKAQIGLKEGMTNDSRYEVLEIESKDGKVRYKRVGVVKPVPGKIWDNRYMAQEEGAYGSNLGATTFKKESGKDFYPGMLLRAMD